MIQWVQGFAFGIWAVFDIVVYSGWITRFFIYFSGKLRTRMTPSCAIWSVRRPGPYLIVGAWSCINACIDQTRVILFSIQVAFVFIVQQTLVTEMAIGFDSVLPDFVCLLRVFVDFIFQVCDKCLIWNITWSGSVSITSIEGMSEGIHRLCYLMRLWVLKLLFLLG